MNRFVNWLAKVVNMSITIHATNLYVTNAATVNVTGAENVHLQNPADPRVDEILSTVTEANEGIRRLSVTSQELTDLLNKVDQTTNHTAENVQVIAETSQKISTEVDAFIAAHPAGTTITEEGVEQLKTIAARSQATSDAADAQVTFLKAIAAKGEPVVPEPAPTPVIS